MNDWVHVTHRAGKLLATPLLGQIIEEVPPRQLPKHTFNERNSRRRSTVSWVVRIEGAKRLEQIMWPPTSALVPCKRDSAAEMQLDLSRCPAEVRGFLGLVQAHLRNMEVFAGQIGKAVLFEHLPGEEALYSLDAAPAGCKRDDLQAALRWIEAQVRVPAHGASRRQLAAAA